MNLPKFRLARKVPAEAPRVEPDPADMGTCFGLDLALTGEPTGSPAASPRASAPAEQRAQRSFWRGMSPRRA